MSRKRYPIDQIITKLREAEVRISRGETVAQACKAIEVTEQTYYRWRKQDNEVRPHSSLGYRCQAPEYIVPMELKPVMNTHSKRTIRWGQIIGDPPPISWSTLMMSKTEDRKWVSNDINQKKSSRNCGSCNSLTAHHTHLK